MASQNKFSRRERQIMDILYLRGEGSVSEVRADMEEAPSYSAVRALLCILENKGHVRHMQEGSRFIYRPSRPRDEAAQSALAQLVRTFFGGSVEQVVASLISDADGPLTVEELDRLGQIIEEAKGEGEKR